MALESVTELTHLGKTPGEAAHDIQGASLWLDPDAKVYAKRSCYHKSRDECLCLQVPNSTLGFVLLVAPSDFTIKHDIILMAVGYSIPKLSFTAASIGSCEEVARSLSYTQCLLCD